MTSIAAMMVRTGEVVRLHLDDRSTVSVAVDDAAGAVAAIRQARGA